MKRIVVAMISVAVFGLSGCARQELPPGLERVSRESFRADDALPADEFVSGWKAVPGSYIYSASEDELWKIYNGAAPGVINDGGREAVTQGYENREGGADKSFRVFILRFVDKPHALTYLAKEIEGAAGGEKLEGVAEGQVFDKSKAAWARLVAGHCLVSVNWEGSDDDTEDATVRAASVIAAKLSSR